MQVEAGSFRDRQARVFYDDRGRVLRGLSAHALAQWQALAATKFFPEAVAAGKIPRSARVDDAGDGAWAAVLEHERIPFLSYPYEWCFGMLRDAALLQLELMQSALREGMILKDATPYNIQWQAGRPVFIDVVSFERLVAGEPWAGYRQFCQLFLYPLLLQAYRDVPFQAWLRGSLEGIEARECRNLLRHRDLLRPGVFAHVWLQAMAQPRPDANLKRELRQAGFHAELIAANVRGLEKVVRKLAWKPAPTLWSRYTDSKPYDQAEGAAKQAFVRWASELRRRRLVWDLGCNTGEFSHIAAENAELVVAIDADPIVIERLYAAASPGKRILPLVVPLADPSPNRGWRLRERRDLSSRGKPELTLCLALIHHMVIGANIPLGEFVEWITALGGDLVIEFVGKDDPMVRDLLRNKADIYDDYERANFERCLQQTHAIERREEIGGGRRVLYYAAARPA